MNKIYVYYESKNIKKRESTTIYFRIFNTYNDAKNLMNQKREEYIHNFNLEPHHIDGNGDKSWTRLFINKSDDYYIDLIIEEKNIE